MEITKYTHSCVGIGDRDRALVVDPGEFSEVEEALSGVHAVLVTHEHPDHIDVDALTRAAATDPELRVWAPSSVAAKLAEMGDRVTAVEAGDAVTAGGFDVRVVGGQHALIHPSVPVVANVGYVLDGAVYHPGDSFTVPTTPVETLLVPMHAPWSKIAEVLDFVIAVRPRRAYPIHDALLSDIGLGLVGGHLERIAGMYGVDYRRLVPVESVRV
jgi:L-ascorbate metabolism protein UlaG (beta-lactamase superfamily)